MGWTSGVRFPAWAMTRLRTGAFSPGVKWPGHGADYSSPSSAVVENAWSYISTLPYVFMAWCLVKHRDRDIE
jgi:hypothetical protein